MSVNSLSLRSPSAASFCVSANPSFQSLAAFTRMLWQPRNLAHSAHRLWLSTAAVRPFSSGSPRLPSPSHMMRTLTTLLSSATFFRSFRYASSFFLSL